MNNDSLKLEDVDRLLASMAKFGVVEMNFRGLQVRRIPDASPARSEAQETDLERLSKMPPDSVDKALALRRMKGGV